jgi:hypothetical protein
MVYLGHGGVLIEKSFLPGAVGNDAFKVDVPIPFVIVVAERAENV